MKYEDWLVDGKVIFPPRKPHTKARLFIKAASDDSNVCFNCFPSKGNEISPIEWFWRINHIEDSLETSVDTNHPVCYFQGKQGGNTPILLSACTVQFRYVQLESKPFGFCENWNQIYYKKYLACIRLTNGQYWSCPDTLMMLQQKIMCLKNKSKAKLLQTNLVYVQGL